MVDLAQGADFARVEVDVRHRSDGTIVLSSRRALSPHPETILEWLADAADRHGSRALLCERRAGDWHRLDYFTALREVEAAASAWLECGMARGDRVLVLAPNGSDHLVASLAALRAGLVTCPLPPRLLHGAAGAARLAQIAGAVEPSAVFLSDPRSCGDAVRTLRSLGLPIASLREGVGADIVLAGRQGSALPPLPQRSEAARIIFTSGSVGAPKGVVYTHGMMTSNLQMTLDLWPFLRKQPQVLIDWLPWHHVFGGNNNVNLMLALAGTLYVDAGSPLPEGLPQTVRNLREVAPTLYCGVPASLAALLPHLESDATLRLNFFSRLQAVFCAGAALPAGTARALEALGQAAIARRIHVLSGWGATETGPGATLVHRAGADVLNIGTPTPGTTVKLAPTLGRYELRVKGPAVTAGYFGRADLTRDAFDDEGYYRTGDAGRLADEVDVSRGLLFDGRLAENFKLANGSWVSTGAVRLELLQQTAGLVRDAIICAPNRPYLGALVWLTCEPDAQVLAELELRLAAQAAGAPATRVRRIRVLRATPSIERGETNDKGYVNQGRCQQTRAADIDKLYDDATPTVSIADHQETFAC